MTALAIKKVSGLCPSGNLDEFLIRYKNSKTLEPIDFTGECAAAWLKELPELLPGLALRRVPRLAKIALRAALEAVPPSPSESALIISTSYGSTGSTLEFLDSILSDGADLASPTAFSHSVTNMTAAIVSQGLRITGPCLTITQPSLKPALAAAFALLASRRVENVLWGIVSEQSNIMKTVESLCGRTHHLLTDGAVFFQLSLPEPMSSDPLIEINDAKLPHDEQPGVGAGSKAEHCAAASIFAQQLPSERNSNSLPAFLDKTIGTGPLALAIRLALTSLFLREGLYEKQTARVINESREFFVVKSGGVSA